MAKKFIDDDAGGLAVQMAYWGFFSVFSLLLAFVSMLGFAFHSDPAFQERVVDSTLRLMPVIGPQISGHIGSLTGSGLALGIGLIAAVWTGLGMTLAASNALDHVWYVPRGDRRGFLSSRVVGLGVLATVGAMMVASTAAVGIAANSAGESTATRLLSFVAGGCVDLVVFLASFRLLTAATVTIRQVWPGAALAAGCWLLLQALGGAYINQVVKGSSDTYGGFAAVVGLLTWLLIAAQMTLVAAEVNVVLARRLWPRSVAGELRTADETALRDSAKADRRDSREQITVSFEEPQSPAPGPTVEAGD